MSPALPSFSLLVAQDREERGKGSLAETTIVLTIIAFSTTWSSVLDAVHLTTLLPCAIGPSVRTSASPITPARILVCGLQQPSWKNLLSEVSPAVVASNIIYSCFPPRDRIARLPPVRPVSRFHPQIPVASCGSLSSAAPGAQLWYVNLLEQASDHVLRASRSSPAQITDCYSPPQP